MSERLTILLSGMMAGVPRQGGATWAVLQYLLGFQELGHDVIFVEPVTVNRADAQSETAGYFKEICDSFDLHDRAALLLEGTRETIGLSYAQLVEHARRADLLVNIAGMLDAPKLTGTIPVRLYLDLDPGFTQLWQEAQGIDMRFDGHTHLATVGLAIGQPDCPVPTAGRPWITTPQPVVLRYWPVTDRIEHDALTTVANWRGYGSIEHEGIHYGQKAHTIRNFFDLPRQSSELITPALSIHPDEQPDISSLLEHGWQWLDPDEVASTPERYQRFIQGSMAEIGFAKSGYVNSCCGWFSDRSVCYLASGRPVIAQETGFSRFIPTGKGLHTFRTTDDILHAIDHIRTDYESEAAAARELAEAVFDSRTVLSSLLDRVGAVG